MAVKPTTPDRSDLETKSREDLQAIAKLTGADVSARASKATLIETIMGTPSGADFDTKPASRAVRSRRTVATPDDDFESLINEFGGDAPSTPGVSTDAPVTPSPRKVVSAESNGSSNGSSNASSNGSTTNVSDGSTVPAPGSSESSNNDSPSNRQGNQPRERQPRDFTNEPGGRNRRNRRNRNSSGNGNAGGRERFGEAMPNADQPYNGELVEIEGLLDLRDDG